MEMIPRFLETLQAEGRIRTNHGARCQVQQSGVTLLELTIIIPLLLLLIVCGVEYARCLRAQQKINSIVREVGGAAFRSCSEENTQSDFQICIERDVFGPIRNYYQNVVPGAEFIISLYRWDNAPTSPTPTSADYVEGPLSVKEPSATSVDSKIKREMFISGSASAPDPLPADLLRDHSILVYAEVFYSYTPIIGPIAGIFNYSGGKFYAITTF